MYKKVKNKKRIQALFVAAVVLAGAGVPIPAHGGAGVITEAVVVRRHVQVNIQHLRFGGHVHKWV
jgi:anthranilate phosphoribosyltransferase